jgi:NADP-dependent 3-hydroxy acid dehydrogenase YdfG
MADPSRSGLTVALQRASARSSVMCTGGAAPPTCAQRQSSRRMTFANSDHARWLTRPNTRDMAETRILEGRRALVTGASRGIGAEIAKAMARAGAAVVVAARDEEALARVAADIEGEGGRAVVAPADVSEPDAVERLVATTVDALGGLDIAVNNAAGGGHGPTPLAEVNEDQFRSALAISLESVFLSIKFEAPAMLESGGGGIVNMASTAAWGA